MASFSPLEFVQMAKHSTIWMARWLPRAAMLVGGTAALILLSYFSCRGALLGGAEMPARCFGVADRPAVRLDLSGCSLLHVPAWVQAHASTLQELNLSDNSLATLPSWLAQFSHLRILFVSQNKFQTLPEVVGRLPRLFMLSFKQNLLQSVPERSLGSSLGWLILTSNRLSRLPADIGRLTGLRKLMLANNALTMLPPEMVGCQALELVRLSNNRLFEFPTVLQSLPGLAWVALEANPCLGPPAATPVGTIPFKALQIGQASVCERRRQGRRRCKTERQGWGPREERFLLPTTAHPLFLCTEKKKREETKSLWRNEPGHSD